MMSDGTAAAAAAADEAPPAAAPVAPAPSPPPSPAAPPPMISVVPLAPAAGPPAGPPAAPPVPAQAQQLQAPVMPPKPRAVTAPAAAVAAAAAAAAAAAMAALPDDAPLSSYTLPSSAVVAAAAALLAKGLGASVADERPMTAAPPRVPMPAVHPAGYAARPMPQPASPTGSRVVPPGAAPAASPVSPAAAPTGVRPQDGEANADSAPGAPPAPPPPAGAAAPVAAPAVAIPPPQSLPAAAAPAAVAVPIAESPPAAGRRRQRQADGVERVRAPSPDTGTRSSDSPLAGATAGNGADGDGEGDTAYYTRGRKRKRPAVYSPGEEPPVVPKKPEPVKPAAPPRYTIQLLMPTGEAPIPKGSTLHIAWEATGGKRMFDSVYVALVKEEKKSDWVYEIFTGPAPNVEDFRRAHLNWAVPMEIDLGGKYYIEVGSTKTNTVGRTPFLRIAPPLDLAAVSTDSDVGVWCPCGATTDVSDSPNTSWVQCPLCCSWQHISCVGLTTTDANSPQIQNYSCQWCALQRFTIVNETVIDQMLLLLKLISDVACYSRRRPTYTRTPPNASQLIGSLIEPHETRVAEFGAGTGAIAERLPKGSLCVEIDAARCEQGKLYTDGKGCRHVWMHADVTCREFVRHVTSGSKFQVIVANADYEVALQFIIVGLFALDRTYPNSRLVFLLPSDFFEGSVARARVFKLLDVHVEMEYRLGHLCYYDHAPDQQKLTCDSLFVLKHGRQDKFKHTTLHAKLAGLL